MRHLRSSILDTHDAPRCRELRGGPDGRHSTDTESRLHRVGLGDVKHDRALRAKLDALLAADGLWIPVRVLDFNGNPRGNPHPMFATPNLPALGSPCVVRQ